MLYNALLETAHGLWKTAQQLLPCNAFATALIGVTGACQFCVAAGRRQTDPAGMPNLAARQNAKVSTPLKRSTL
jgi:hypothetical protein